jgi:signal transduction histidine kinase
MSLITLIQPCDELFGEYSTALLAWIAAGKAEGHEPRLARARELGREALARGAPRSEMLALHGDSVRQILALMRNSDECRKCQDPAPCDDVHRFLRSLTPQDTMAAAGVFLAESMAPFDTDERQLRRSNAALRYQNDKLANELQRFTGIVYDEGLQLLAVARLKMDEATRALEPSVCRPLAEVQQLLDALEEQLSACSDSARPRMLNVLGPRAAVESFCRNFARSSGLEVKAELGRFPVQSEIGVPLYRAVREALTNVERHAQATRVRVWVHEENSAIHCFIQDDGAGFDVPTVFSAMETRGSGLAAVEEDLRTVGGTMVIKSVQGTGTALRISIKRQKNSSRPDGSGC